MLASILALSLQPAIQVSGVFSDHMVLQRERWVPIWGWAPPGERVWAEGSWGSSAETKADKSGKWSLKLRTRAAGGPFRVSVGGMGTTKTFEDVLVGEVWLCGGQSNMEWPVGNIGYQPPIEGADYEVAAANYPKIRLLQVPRAGSDVPLSNLNLAWQTCTPDTVKTFSATGFLFGKNLFQELNIPIGLISSNIGGTEVELWMKRDKLRAVPGLAERVDQADRDAENYKKQIAKWNALSRAGDTMRVLEAGSANGWTPIDGAKSYDQIGLGQFDGVVWYRAEFDLPQVPANATLDLGTIDDEDRTFVNGELVGSMYGWTVARSYSVPASVLKKGRNVVVIKVIDTAGGGGFGAGSKPVLRTPGGDVNLTGWSYTQGVAPGPLPPRPRVYSTLYNGMIAPLAPYAIQGAIWYQGESNVGRAAQYGYSFPAMIENWREDFQNPLMPFYFVQIAPFTPYGNGGAAAELREMQRQTLKLRRTGMVVTTDITPNLNDIHPAKKREVGERLAKWALARTYHQNIEHSGPLLRSVVFDGGKAVLSFTHSAGLEARGGDLLGFTVAGADRVFRPASARIDGGKIVVWSDRVKKPAAVRYGWSSAPVLNLFNSAGLPASPFRTDTWKMETAANSW